MKASVGQDGSGKVSQLLKLSLFVVIGITSTLVPRFSLSTLHDIVTPV